MASDVQGALLIYERDVVVYANTAAQLLHPQQDWSATVTFDGIFRVGVEQGRINDPAILADPETHLAYARMARAREQSFQFRRRYDGVPFDRYHTGVNADWNAQIWVPARRSVFDDDCDEIAPGLQELAKRNRVQATTAALLERMGVAVAVVTAEGRLIDSSSLMVRRLRSGGALERGLGNRLTCDDPENAMRLHRAIAAVVTGREGEALVPIDDGAAVQLVAVMPARGGHAIVVVQDIAPPEPLQELLVSAYGLTRRQAEVAVRVAAGESAEQIATALDRKLGTVRRQIATSKAKIAVGGQQDIARIVTRAATLFGGIPLPKIEGDHNGEP
ncbi:helix-turn-helix transcriptional regulator [Azospirillum picis]|uniref:DNA-binding CsgD family transcriptional regulator n=1 Tax=Azospirillum picis TaxID=488438 RepID=A0ABU0MDT2_9PROT|nr:LuxR C-terminal-related transcriptional regulator [Azospirillum picis]MBP2297379.1 DNA-binding CsgD family transcriptional regulator [Azospirillum picis]MDQ0531598.1 DNA-binding CsgD family transcriptional regulator [Azospirillum picis]